MKVVQICVGRFHHFDLARQLEKSRALQRIYTAYPRWKLGQEGLPPERIATFPWLQTFYMAKGRLGLTNARLDRELAWWTNRTLDGYVARRLEACDVLVALSGAGLAAGRVQRRRGGAFVCDRGSSHIRFQDRILAEEHARWDSQFPGVDPRMIAREEAEYQEADLITVPSEFARRSFLAAGISGDKVAKIPYGVDLRRFAPVAAPPADTFQVLFVGQLSLRKGLPYLLEAFAGLQVRRKKLVLIGPILPEIRPWLAGLDATVEVLGPRPQAQLKEWMSRSHVLVQPSIEEGLALVQAQALACGCPVIGSENSGAEDLFTDGREGFIVKIRDAVAIRDRLETMARDPGGRAAMAQAALERVHFIGGWDDYGRNYERTLRMLVEK